ncbi:MAG: L,D-transpeptidase family protein [Alphaproteobacteria bacterium]|nr:L,D-transpeptidase family protein [Alphaproteobacteria bacterium]
MTTKKILLSFTISFALCLGLSSFGYTETQNEIVKIDQNATQIGAASSPEKTEVQNATGFQSAQVSASLVNEGVSHIREIVTDSNKSFASFMDINPNFVSEFYAAHQYQPVWIEQNQWNTKAKIALDALHHSQNEGLFPQDYVIHLLPLEISSQNLQEQSQLDVRLTSAFMQYIVDVSYGRRELRKTNEDRTKAAPEPDARLILTEGLKTNDFSSFVAGLPPKHAGYKLLREILIKKEHHTVVQLPPIPAISNLTLNKNDPAIKLLHDHLLAKGDLEEPSLTPTIFDQTMRDALKKFQKRHQLGANGVLNPVTRAAFNRPQMNILKKIAINMERWRWLPHSTSKKNILVNVPGFMLYAYDNDQLAFEKRVIVGNEHRETPIFSAPMTSVKFNPTWSVPPRIAARDILPQIQEDPQNFFSFYRMRVSSAKGGEIDPHSVNWANVSPSNFPYRLVQMPGSNNALGKIRFSITNPYDIYLHDTSSRENFDKDVRTLSSGCIRVKDPEVLANFVLSDSQKWNLTQVKAAMQGSNTNVVNLPSSIDVHIMYATVFVDHNKVLHVYDDVYERDNNIMRLLDMDKKKLTAN